MISGKKENANLSKHTDQSRQGEKGHESSGRHLSHHETTHHMEGQKHEGAHMHEMEMEGAKMFENPMKEYFMMADQLSRLFALIMGLKFKLFDSIEELDTKADTNNILKKVNFKTSPRHMLDLLDQLYIHGYLSREGNLEQAVYKNSEYTRKYLLRKNADNYDDVYLNLFRYIKKFENLENDFSSGITRMFSDDISSSEEDLRGYMCYFYKVNKFNFEFITNNFDFNKYKKVIDLHGLSGDLAKCIKKKFPNCEVVSFENSKLKNILSDIRTKQNVSDENVCFEYGDLLKDKLPESDCVIMPHILMQFSREHREKILKMVYESLRPNGEIIIMENLLDPERSKDSHGLKISFMLGLLGYEGYVMTFDEYNEIISSIGFKNIERISKGQGVSDFIVAKK